MAKNDETQKQSLSDFFIGLFKKFFALIFLCVAIVILVFAAKFAFDTFIRKDKGFHPVEAIEVAILEAYKTAENTITEIDDAVVNGTTEADLVTYLETSGEMGKLQVLSANVIKNKKIESGFNQEDKVLMATYQTLIFTVDLSDIDPVLEGDKYIVKIPEPEPDLNNNTNEEGKYAEVLNERMKHSWDGSYEHGYNEAYNTLCNNNDVSLIDNYDYLKEEAREAAKIQVQELLQDLQVKGKNIEVKGEWEYEQEER